MIDDLSLTKKPHILLQRDIVIYGCGNTGEQFYNCIKGSGIKIIGFCDSDERKCHKNKDEIPVVSFSELVEIYKKKQCIIIIASVYLQEIASRLLEYGILESDIYSYFWVKYVLYLNIKHIKLNETFRQRFIKQYEYWRAAELGEYYSLCSYHYYAIVWKRFFNENPILVYQFGKVGSSSITKGLQELGIPVEQVHALAFEKSFMSIEMEELYKLFIEAVKGKEEVKIISLVREPIIRDISMIFELIEETCLDIFEDLNTDFIESIEDILKNKVITNEEEKMTLGPISYRFDYKLRGMNGNIFDWYENELKNVFGIDILDYTFNKEEGYGYIEKDNIKILLLKLEKLKNNERRIGEFIGNTNFRLLRQNIAKNKVYYYVYRNVIRNLQVPLECVERYYCNNKYMKYFYTEEERKMYLDQWTENKNISKY